MTIETPLERPDEGEKLDDLKAKLRHIAKGNDAVFKVEDDTLVLIDDRGFLKTVRTDMMDASMALQGDEMFTVTKEEKFQIDADLNEPVGNIRKVSIRIRKGGR